MQNTSRLNFCICTTDAHKLKTASTGAGVKHKNGMIGTPRILADINIFSVVTDTSGREPTTMSNNVKLVREICHTL